MNRETKRITSLDLVKSLAIFFVCFYHYNNFDINILGDKEFTKYLAYFIKGVAGCGVPLFFMANGAILLNKNLDIKKHLKKTVKITILTGIWGILTLLILMPIKGEYMSISEIVKSLITMKMGWINHLWFLPALVCIYIIFPIIKSAYDSNKSEIIFYFLFIVFILTFGNTFINMLGNIAQ